MAFGQQSGPPATQRQLQDLVRLLNDAGHEDFRDARGPLGFTQRQAAGKFTRDEADAYIARLEAERDSSESSGPAHRQADEPVHRSEGPKPRLKRGGASGAGTQHRALAAELQRRGWVVLEP
ncbi:MAG: hypothetical protein R2715_15985 [Ilumatobacteraceae bacterium]